MVYLLLSMQEPQYRIGYFFDELVFDEERHRYSALKKYMQSVTGIIGNFVEYVDWEEKAQNVADRKNLTKQQVLDSWKKLGKVAAEDGTEVHFYAEEDHLRRAAIRKKEEAVDAFYADLDKDRYVIISKELRMWHKKFWFAGTADLIIYDKQERYFIIADWKTNKDIYKNFRRKTLLEPFTDVLDSPFGKFCIQLSFYQLMFEQTGYDVRERWVIWLKDKEGEPPFIIEKTPDYTARLQMWLEDKNFII